MPLWLSFAAIGAIVRSVMLGLGLGVVVFKGLDMILQMVVSRITSELSGLPANALDTLSYFGALSALSVVLSAYSVRLAMVAVRQFRAVGGAK